MNFTEWFNNHNDEPVFIVDHIGGFYMCSCMNASAHHNIERCPVCGIKWDWSNVYDD